MQNLTTVQHLVGFVADADLETFQGLRPQVKDWLQATVAFAEIETADQAVADAKLRQYFEAAADMFSSILSVPALEAGVRVIRADEKWQRIMASPLASNTHYFFPIAGKDGVAIMVKCRLNRPTLLPGFTLKWESIVTSLEAVIITKETGGAKFLVASLVKTIWSGRESWAIHDSNSINMEGCPFGTIEKLHGGEKAHIVQDAQVQDLQALFEFIASKFKSLRGGSDLNFLVEIDPYRVTATPRISPEAPPTPSPRGTPP